MLGRSQNSSRDQSTLLQITRREMTGKAGKESLDSLTEGLCESIADAVTNPNLKRSKHLVHYLCSQFRDQLPLMTSGCFAFPTDDLLTSFLRLQGKPKPDFLVKLIKGFFFPKVSNSCEVQGDVTTLRGFTYQRCAGGLRVGTECLPWQRVSSTSSGSLAGFGLFPRLLLSYTRSPFDTPLTAEATMRSS